MPWVVADLDTVFSDLDSDSLTFNVSGENITASTEGSQLVLHSLQDFYGEAAVVVEASDEQPLVTSDTFLVDILPVNDAPSSFDLLLPPDQAILINAKDSVFFKWDNAVDPEGHSLNYQFWLSDSLGNHLIDSLVDKTELELYLALEPSSSYQWSVLCIDDTFAIASRDSFSLHAAGSAPLVINPIGDLTFYHQVEPVLVADLDSVFLDIDSPRITVYSQQS